MAQESIAQLGAQALELSKNSIVVNMRFMASACARLKGLPIAGSTFATDGNYLRYSPAWAARTYAEEPAALARNYLHAVMHCVFLHPFAGESVNAPFWDAACDIVVENSITGLNLGVVRCAREARQAATCAEIAGNVKHFTAEAVYRYLLDRKLTLEELEALREPFYADDHEPWHAPYVKEDDKDAGKDGEEEEGGSRGGHATKAAPNGTDMELPPEADQIEKSHKSSSGLAPEDITQKEAPKNSSIAIGQRMANTINLDRTKETWEDAALELGIQMDSYATLWGTEGANMKMNLTRVTRKRTDYRVFLRKFAVMGEHLLINDDEFDYVYYCFGLQRYGNLPLIEPLEYTEQKRIKEFVIAIDTSSSTKNGLVRKFLEQTYSILTNESSFSTKMDVTIIQCDAEITDIYHVKERKDFDRYLDNLEVKGLGGTDFRPVFGYVNDQIELGEITNFGGVIYFTDGQGTYPTKAPDYNVCFAFVDEIPTDPPVPTWAMKIQLEETEFLEETDY
ncbi:MAG: VWA-like domain-containing protein [Coriobacteriaceae bacterium]|nr:VWA-like domain-containing protein [Coriobacteriaceae bacterium]